MPEKGRKSAGTGSDSYAISGQIQKFTRERSAQIVMIGTIKNKSVSFPHAALSIKAAVLSQSAMHTSCF